MTQYGLGIFILRVIIPILISANLIMRPSLMCAIYLGMLLYLPFLNLIDQENLNIGIFKYIMIFVPYQTAATQLGFYLYTLATDEILTEENVEMLRILKSIGLSPLDQLSIIRSICWFGPEVIMILVSILYTWAVRMVASKTHSEDTQEDAEEVRKEKMNRLKTSTTVGKCITILLLFLCAMWRHTLFGVCYFVIFLFFMSIWALKKSLNYMLSMVLLFCMPIAMVHTIGIYMFQIEGIQYQLSDKMKLLSIIGIDKLLQPIPAYGPDFTHYETYTKDIVKILYPVIVYILYYFMVNEAVRLKSLEKFLADEKKRLYLEKWKRRKKGAIEMAVEEPELIKPTTKSRYLLESSHGDSKTNLLWKHTCTIIRTVIALVVKYTYIGTICAYMMWSVTFLTWSSFVLLTLGIILWMLPHQKKATVYSCFVVIPLSYLNMTYVYLIGVGDGQLIGKLTEDESSIFEYFAMPRYKSLEVCIKVLLTLMFWITVRKYMQDRAYRNLEAFFAEEAKTTDRTIPEEKGNVLEKILLYFLVRYWLAAIAVSLMAWTVSVKTLKIFRIMNVFYYLSFMLLLQLSFRWWRKILKGFLIFLLIMTLINMMIIYGYQFKSIERFFQQTLGIPEDFGDDFGARISNTGPHIHRLFGSMIFITMILIQLRFFHKKFMSLTDENNKTIHAEVEEYTELFGKFFRWFIDVSNIVFLFLEMHLIKAITLLLLLMCILDVGASYALILIPLCLSMILPIKSVRLAVIYWAMVLVSFQTVGSLIYSLRYFDESDYDITCNVTKYPYANQTTYNWMSWMGFEKYDKKSNKIIHFIAWETGFVLSSCLRNVVIAVQRTTRKQQGLPTKPPKVLFPEVTYREADLNLKNYIKYLVNYGFYRIGYEICLTMIVIVIVLRLDGYSIMYSVWLCLFLILRRSIVRWTWIIFVTFVALSIIWQYIMRIGLPPTWCIEYEWETRTYYWTVAQDFWFLIDNYHPPPIEKLIAESILLVVASQQMICFWIEIKNSRRKIDYDGGSNSSIIPHFEEPGFVNPVVDFTTYTTSYLDVAKRIFFNMSYWGCMWIVFLGSVNRVNIFSIVYLCYVFIYLWHGINIYYKPLTVILKYWNRLIIQNVLVICLKSGLQVIGCFYMPDIPMQYCGLIKLFGIGCIRNFENTDYFEKLDEGKTICRASQIEMAGVDWDAAIFFILIMQRRVFRSYNFFHIINDAKAQHLLSARGALFLDELHEMKIRDMRYEEKRVRETVRYKLNNLLVKKKQIQDSFYRNSVITHKMAIRSGDYYMYEEYETDVEERVTTFQQREEERKDRLLKPEHNLISLFGDMFDGNMRTAVRRYWEPSVKKKGNEIEDDKETYGMVTKIIYFFKFFWAVTDVVIVNATKFFERYTRRYDMVRAKLDKEKRLLKEQTDYDMGVRIEGWWLPSASYEDLIKNSKLPHPKKPPEEMSTTDLPDFLKLLKAFWIITVARSDLLCYICVMMNQVMLCQLITIPLSCMVYMWGMLSNPRPSKTFWILTIGYVELVVLLKCLFQYEMMPGNNLLNEKNENNPMEAINPFFPSKFMGLHKMEYYYLWEMFTLMAILIHRHYLTSIGLWTTLTTSAEAKKTDGFHTLENGALIECMTVLPASTASRKLYVVRTKTSSILDNILVSIKIILLRYASSIQEFYQRLLLHVHQEAHDHYTVMFFFDFLAFLTVATTFPDFFVYEPKDTVWTYLSTSVVPVRYVMVVFIHFMCILIDRAIYLKKSVVVKLLFHHLHTALVHIWLFVLVPHFINGRIAIEKGTITAYYIFRCIYLLISAQQIRIGYPSRIWGIYCCKGFGLWNYFNIRGYKLIPFLFELRSSFDWMFTDTTMSVFDWFRMDDIYTSVYKVKCLRRIEEEYGSPPGVMKKAIYKYTYGLSLSIFFVILIWFPLMVYSWGREAGESNVPSASTLKFQIGDVEPIYDNKAVIFKLHNVEFQYIRQVYNAYDVSKEFLYKYDHTDVAVLIFMTGAQTWLMRPQEEKKILRVINSAHPLPITMTCSITLTDADEQKVIEISKKNMLFPNSLNRKNLAGIIEDQNTDQFLRVGYLLPKFLKVEQRGIVSMVDLLMHPEPNAQMADRLRNISLTPKLATEGQGQMWWMVKEDVEDENYAQFLNKMPYGSATEDCMVIFSFSDKVVHAFFNIVTGGSIITFYSVFLFVVHGWSRQIISDRVPMIWLYELPQADVIYAMCKEVYICREAKMWELEEVAAGRVFFLIRSSETTLKLSRYLGNPYNPNTSKVLPSITRRS